MRADECKMAPRAYQVQPMARLPRREDELAARREVAPAEVAAAAA